MLLTTASVKIPELRKGDESVRRMGDTSLKYFTQKYFSRKVVNIPSNNCLKNDQTFPSFLVWIQVHIKEIMLFVYGTNRVEIKLPSYLKCAGDVEKNEWTSKMAPCALRSHPSPFILPHISLGKVRVHTSFLALSKQISVDFTSLFVSSKQLSLKELENEKKATCSVPLAIITVSKLSAGQGLFSSITSPVIPRKHKGR